MIYIFHECLPLHIPNREVDPTYKFEARYEDCDGGPLGAEIFGRCQHPIVAGSGTGVFNGVTGQINLRMTLKQETFHIEVACSFKVIL